MSIEPVDRKSDCGVRRTKTIRLCTFVKCTVETAIELGEGMAIKGE